jgi:rod shape-determining protein MreC
VLDLLKKYRTPLLSGILILIALLFYSANLRSQEKTTIFERTVLQLTAPLQNGISFAWNSVSGWWHGYFWLVDTQRNNARLLDENRHLQAELSRLQEVALANERLRRLLQFKEEINLPVLPAQVIAEDASSWFRTVVIDKGLADGLREGLPVVVAEGAAGRVISCASRHSRVLLVTDASSAVAALVQRNRTRGIIRGQGDNLVFEYALRQADIEVGDQLVSSGTGGVFPKGVPIGRITRITREEYGLFQTVEVAPAVDFSRLEEVLILLKDPPQ